MSCSTHVAALGDIDDDSRPRQYPICQRVPNEGVAHHGVKCIPDRLEDHILAVFRDGLRVAVVRRQSVDLGDEVLVEKDLTHVRGGRVDIGPVRLEGAVGLVHHDVDVRRAASVVSRKDGNELRHARAVGLLQAAQGDIVEIGAVGRVAVAGCDYSRVNAGGVGYMLVMPCHAIRAVSERAGARQRDCIVDVPCQKSR